MPGDAQLEYGAIAVGLLGGLALFLFGLEQMTDALKRVAGGGMRAMLARLSTNRFTAALTGAIVTAVIQSSSVTTVLVVGFVSAGLMTLSQSVGIIMGANIGTTITAQIVAFKVTAYALVLVAAGFGMTFLSKRGAVRDAGFMIMGLGLVFFGMGLMSEATHPLRTYQPFIDAMQRMDNPFFAILLAAGFTALVQSSSATTGIVIVLASQGFITLEAGIALAFGANVGTCVTALLAALGKPRAAVRVAAVHVAFNVLGVLIWLPFIEPLAELVRSFSPSAPQLEGLARLGAETPRQIANAHTAFNLGNTALLIWFTGPMARLATRLIPDRAAPIPEAARPRFLDEVYLDTPALAVDLVRLEVGHLGALVQELMRTLLAKSGDEPAAEREHVSQRVEEVEILYRQIVDYARQLLSRDLSEPEAERTGRWIVVANNLQAMADTIGVNVASLVGRIREQGIEMSPETRTRFRALHAQVADALDRAIRAVDGQDAAVARQAIDLKGEITRLCDDIAQHLVVRLASPAPDRLALYRLESAGLEVYRRLYYLAKRIAKTVQGVTEPEAVSMADTES